MPVSYFRAWDVVLAVTDVTFDCGKLVEKHALALDLFLPALWHD
jgi:hypothetical protein